MFKEPQKSQIFFYPPKQFFDMVSGFWNRVVYTGKDNSCYKFYPDAGLIDFAEKMRTEFKKADRVAANKSKFKSAPPVLIFGKDPSSLKKNKKFKQNLDPSLWIIFNEIYAWWICNNLQLCQNFLKEIEKSFPSSEEDSDIQKYNQNLQSSKKTAEQNKNFIIKKQDNQDSILLGVPFILKQQIRQWLQVLFKREANRYLDLYFKNCSPQLEKLEALIEEVEDAKFSDDKISQEFSTTFEQEKKKFFSHPEIYTMPENKKDDPLRDLARTNSIDSDTESTCTTQFSRPPYLNSSKKNEPAHYVIATKFSEFVKDIKQNNPFILDPDKTKIFYFQQDELGIICLPNPLSEKQLVYYAPMQGEKYKSTTSENTDDETTYKKTLKTILPNTNILNIFDESVAGGLFKPTIDQPAINQSHLLGRKSTDAQSRQIWFDNFATILGSKWSIVQEFKIKVQNLVWPEIKEANNLNKSFLEENISSLVEGRDFNQLLSDPSKLLIITRICEAFYNSFSLPKIEEGKRAITKKIQKDTQKNNGSKKNKDNSGNQKKTNHFHEMLKTHCDDLNKIVLHNIKVQIKLLECWIKSSYGCFRDPFKNIFNQMLSINKNPTSPFIHSSLALNLNQKKEFYQINTNGRKKIDEKNNTCTFHGFTSTKELTSLMVDFIPSHIHANHAQSEYINHLTYYLSNVLNALSWPHKITISLEESEKLRATLKTWLTTHFQVLTSHIHKCFENLENILNNPLKTNGGIFNKTPLYTEQDKITEKLQSLKKLAIIVEIASRLQFIDHYQKKEINQDKNITEIPETELSHILDHIQAVEHYITLALNENALGDITRAKKNGLELGPHSVSMLIIAWQIKEKFFQQCWDIISTIQLTDTNAWSVHKKFTQIQTTFDDQASNFANLHYTELESFKKIKAKLQQQKKIKNLIELKLKRKQNEISEKKDWEEKLKLESSPSWHKSFDSFITTNNTSYLYDSPNFLKILDQFIKVRITTGKESILYQLYRHPHKKNLKSINTLNTFKKDILKTLQNDSSLLFNVHVIIKLRIFANMRERYEVVRIINNIINIEPDSKICQYLQNIRTIFTKPNDKNLKITQEIQLIKQQQTDIIVDFLQKPNTYNEEANIFVQKCIAELTTEIEHYSSNSNTAEDLTQRINRIIRSGIRDGAFLKIQQNNNQPQFDSTITTEHMAIFHALYKKLQKKAATTSLRDAWDENDQYNKNIAIKYKSWQKKYISAECDVANIFTNFLTYFDTKKTEVNENNQALAEQYTARSAQMSQKGVTLTTVNQINTTYDELSSLFQLFKQIFHDRVKDIKDYLENTNQNKTTGETTIMKIITMFPKEFARFEHIAKSFLKKSVAKEDPNSKKQQKDLTKLLTNIKENNVENTQPKAQELMASLNMLELTIANSNQLREGQNNQALPIYLAANNLYTTTKNTETTIKKLNQNCRTELQNKINDLSDKLNSLGKLETYIETEETVPITFQGNLAKRFLKYVFYYLAIFLARRNGLIPTPRIKNLWNGKKAKKNAITSPEAKRTYYVCKETKSILDQLEKFIQQPINSGVTFLSNTDKLKNVYEGNFDIPENKYHHKKTKKWEKDPKAKSLPKENIKAHENAKQRLEKLNLITDATKINNYLFITFVKNFPLNSDSDKKKLLMKYFNQCVHVQSVVPNKKHNLKTILEEMMQQNQSSNTISSDTVASDNKQQIENTKNSLQNAVKIIENYFNQLISKLDSQDINLKEKDLLIKYKNLNLSDEETIKEKIFKKIKDAQQNNRASIKNSDWLKQELFNTTDSTDQEAKYLLAFMPLNKTLHVIAQYSKEAIQPEKQKLPKEIFTQFYVNTQYIKLTNTDASNGHDLLKRCSQLELDKNVLWLYYKFATETNFDTISSTKQISTFLKIEHNPTSNYLRFQSLLDILTEKIQSTSSRKEGASILQAINGFEALLQKKPELSGEDNALLSALKECRKSLINKVLGARSNYKKITQDDNPEEGSMIIKMYARNLDVFTELEKIVIKKEIKSDSKIDSKIKNASSTIPLLYYLQIWLFRVLSEKDFTKPENLNQCKTTYLNALYTHFSKLKTDTTVANLCNTLAKAVKNQQQLSIQSMNQPNNTI